MDFAALRAAFDQDQRINVTFPDGRRTVVSDADGLTIRHTGLLTNNSAILYSQIAGTGDAQIAALDRVIAREIAHFTALGHQFEWKTYDYDQPPGLIERLAAHGFAIGEPESLLVLALDTAPAALLKPVTADVRRVTTAAEVWTGMNILETVWGSDKPGRLDQREVGESLIAQLTSHPDEVAIYLAHAADGTPAAIAWISFHVGSAFAGLWGGATLPAYRGQGLYTALVAARAQDAIRRGVRYLTIDASAMSAPICRKQGFIPLGVTTPCLYVPAGIDSTEA